MEKVNITPELIAAQSIMLLNNDKEFAATYAARCEQNAEDANKFLFTAAIYALWKANK